VIKKVITSQKKSSKTRLGKQVEASKNPNLGKQDGTGKNKNKNGKCKNVG
jgi:hypothetical protein